MSKFLDLVFRFLVLAALFVFLFLYYNNSQNARYQIHNDDSGFNIFDTRTGALYVPRPKDHPSIAAVELNFVTGQDRIVPSKGKAIGYESGSAASK